MRNEKTDLKSTEKGFLEGQAEEWLRTKIHDWTPGFVTKGYEAIGNWLWESMPEMEMIDLSDLILNPKLKKPELKKAESNPTQETQPLTPSSENPSDVLFLSIYLFLDTLGKGIPRLASAVMRWSSLFSYLQMSGIAFGAVGAVNNNNHDFLQPYSPYSRTGLRLRGGYPISRESVPLENWVSERNNAFSNSDRSSRRASRKLSQVSQESSEGYRFPQQIDLTQLNGENGERLENDNNAVPTSFSSADINGDGKTDTVVGMIGEKNIYIRWGSDDPQPESQNLSAGGKGITTIKLNPGFYSYDIARVGHLTNSRLADFITVSVANNTVVEFHGFFGKRGEWPAEMSVADADFTLPKGGEDFGDLIICDLDGNRIGDIVLSNGLYGDKNTTTTVYWGPISRGKVPSPTGKMSVIFGARVGDQEGAPLVCEDMDRDGIKDLGLAAPNEVESTSSPSKLYLVWGQKNWLAEISLSNFKGVTFIGGPNTVKSLASLGDIRGDGTTAIGISGYTSNWEDGGITHVVFSQRYWNKTLDLSTLNGENGVTFKSPGVYPVAQGGDVNRDGRNDLLFGMYPNSPVLVFGRENWSAEVQLEDLVDGKNGFEFKGDDDWSLGFWMSQAENIDGRGMSAIILPKPNWPSNNSTTYMVFFPPAQRFKKNELQILPGSNRITLSSENINATSAGFHPRELMITVESVFNGKFMLNGTEVSSFSQGDVWDGKVVFECNTTSLPSYTLNYTTQYSGIGAYQLANVTFVPAPSPSSFPQPSPLPHSQGDLTNGNSAALMIALLCGGSVLIAASLIVFYKRHSKNLGADQALNPCGLFCPPKGRMGDNSATERLMERPDGDDPLPHDGDAHSAAVYRTP